MRRSVREKLLGEAVRCAAEALTFEEMAGSVLPILGRMLDAPIQLCFGIREGVKPHAYFVTPPEMYRRFVAEERYRDYPLFKAGMRERLPPGAIAQSRIYPQREFRRSSFYNEVFRPFGAEYQAMLPLAPEWWIPGMTGISLTRARGQADFSAEDVGDLARVGSSLAGAARRLRRAERILADTEVQALVVDRHPALAFEGTGALLWMSGSARAAVGSEASPLLAGAAQRLLGGDGFPQLVLRLTLADGSPAVAQLRVARRASGEPFVIAELDGPRFRGEALARVAAEHGLTPAEQRVVALAVEGLRNAEIAERLRISPGTVRIELSNAFRKLRVSSRVQAILLLLRG